MGDGTVFRGVRCGQCMPVCCAGLTCAGALGSNRLGIPPGAAVGLAMAARFPMDPVGTPRERVSFSGKMHGVAFLVGVSCQLLAVLLLSLALRNQASHASLRS